MNNYSLGELLSKVLISPLSDDKITLLESICTSYIEDIDDYNIDMCVKSFVFQVVNESLSTFCKTYEDDDAEDIDDDSQSDDNEEMLNYPRNIAPIVNVVMSGYCCHLICISDDLRAASICSLNIMNSVKQKCFDAANLLFPDMIEGMYDKFENYKRSKLNEIRSISNISKVMSEIFEDKLDLETIEDAEELNDKIKFLAYNASLNIIENDIKNHVIDAGSSVPYVDVFLAIKHIITESPWIFINNDAKTQISTITSKLNSVNKKTIRDILNDIIQEEICGTIKVMSSSSIILRTLASDDSTQTSMFLKQKVTVNEFAIALYYELLLEKLLNEY